MHHSSKYLFKEVLINVLKRWTAWWLCENSNYNAFTRGTQYRQKYAQCFENTMPMVQSYFLVFHLKVRLCPYFKPIKRHESYIRHTNYRPCIILSVINKWIKCRGIFATFATKLFISPYIMYLIYILL